MLLGRTLGWGSSNTACLWHSGSAGPQVARTHISELEQIRVLPERHVLTKVHTSPVVVQAWAIGVWVRASGRAVWLVVAGATAWRLTEFRLHRNSGFDSCENDLADLLFSSVFRLVDSGRGLGRV